jgi:glycosyltransferase involved in cell wall biosynthesis
MRRLLVLTYYFPPDVSPGARRIAGLVRHLPEFGWDPVCFTWPDPQRRARAPVVHETRSPGPLASRWWRERGAADEGAGTVDDAAPVPGRLRQLLAPVRSAVMTPDGETAWGLLAAATAARAHQKTKFDAILSTSPPHSVQVAASLTQAMTGLPWLADYRDLWTDYHYYAFSERRRAIDRQIELAALRRATEIVSVSPLQADILARTHGRSRVHTVLTGFSEAEAASLAAAPAGARSGRFRVVHAGKLYEHRRTPELVFKALHRLVGEGVVGRDDVQFDFYGQPEAHVDALAREFGISATQHGFVPRETVLAAERASDLQLLLTWFHPEEATVIPSKLFEYLAAGRPILATGIPEQACGPILTHTRGGVLASDLDGVVAALRPMLVAWKEGLPAPFAPDPAALQQYTQRGAARQFAALLDEMCSRSTRS